jgi:hypothetical protein
MIAALYSSRQGGAKDFNVDGISFGWTAILKLYVEDLRRAKEQLNLLVPGMKLSYVVRDPWTRLNVQPAKIMQKDACIAGLLHMAQQNNDDGMRKTAHFYKHVTRFLREDFYPTIMFLMVTRLLDVIQEGMDFLPKWTDDVRQRFPGVSLINPRQKHFLSWQTWELMRVAHGGLKGLCDDFLRQYPMFHIYPKRINGSAVETLFSQFKYLTGGKLSAVNYETARAAYLTKVDVHGRRFADEYRNAPLHIQQADLQRL